MKQLNLVREVQLWASKINVASIWPIQANTDESRSYASEIDQIETPPSPKIQDTTTMRSPWEGPQNANETETATLKHRRCPRSTQSNRRESTKSIKLEETTILLPAYRVVSKADHTLPQQASMVQIKELVATAATRLISRWQTHTYDPRVIRCSYPRKESHHEISQYLGGNGTESTAPSSQPDHTGHPQSTTTFNTGYIAHRVHTRQPPVLSPRSQTPGLTDDQPPGFRNQDRPNLRCILTQPARRVRDLPS
ncbi:uncharacterized protein BO97DRAFT_479580 [Aspergillus homomorphus CBS 101889]|uniref:Uncharacterized protein n=1 Tax=Aspergillus homomorphus (strain CBS 101889) TaxID=1450537 RepID=A0A395HQN0_ASPHC|nr:hypothetical protein BO97DRAFT_479580 [Aspergillus homomorphus CBS 101889]RAL09906.1 hypothetical protein BO97DRAFT_479580 [Aspergillus homomorphus CBS 101889]